MKNQMDEKFQALRSIIHGCELAKQVETNLHALANQPTSLLSSCEEICRAFNNAINLLNPHQPSAHFAQTIFGGPSESSSAGPSLERGGFTQAMDMFYPHGLGRSPFEFQMLPERSMDVRETLPRAGKAEASARSSPVGELQVSETDSGGSSLGGTSVQRPSRR